MILEKTVTGIRDLLNVRKLEKVEEQNKESPNFICRICGSKKFKEVYKNNEIIGPGGRSRRVYCVCGGCSVIFEDPEKFSDKQS